MGDTLWINIRRGDSRECNEADHSAMMGLADQLDRLANHLGVAALSTYYDDTDLRYNFDESREFEESEAGWPNDAANWFEPADALKSVQAIIGRLEKNPRDIALGHWSMDDLMWELTDTRTELERAVGQGNKFHFCIVM